MTLKYAMMRVKLEFSAIIYMRKNSSLHYDNSFGKEMGEVRKKNNRMKYKISDRLIWLF